MQEGFLRHKLLERDRIHALRKLSTGRGKIDFCSNDYLGIIRNGRLEASGLLSGGSVIARHGSGGSRLLAGNYPLIEETERFIASFHDAPAGLIFNSGYDANLGLISAVAGRGDTILYDQLSHASIRDGVRLSLAQAFSFAHNDLEDLEKRLRLARGNIFVVTESVFSMDGDTPPLQEMVRLTAAFGANLVVDEAHATGVIGERGEGLMQLLNLHHHCFARVHTFGKALGCHGAIILGDESLKEYLINFCRPFIYTTALPESSVQAIKAAYQIIPGMSEERSRLASLIMRFREAALLFPRTESNTAIQGVVVPGNESIKELAQRLQSAGLDVRPILYPTVPKGTERLRIVLHSFNSPEELDHLLRELSTV
jgi:8-amino-7-oxononanoate synthase